MVAEFQQLNERYNYFDLSDAGVQTQLLDKFKLFFKVCLLYEDFIEDNDDLETETIAEHAYKMMALFGRNNESSVYFKSIDDFMRNHNLLNNPEYPTPLDAIFSFGFPANVYQLNGKNEQLDLDAWLKLIHRSGIAALRNFAGAVQVEKLGLEGQETRVPATIVELRKRVAKVTYAGASDAPDSKEFADLCTQYYLISEDSFQRAMAIYRNRKKTDRLPNIRVSGEEVGHPGYEFVKLPIDDMRALILGNIVNCCQSIGAHSQQCVIDGIQREHNGFYVLLKRKKGNETAPVFVDGKINYAAFDLVGQSYAWIGKGEEGNMTFDSWENLHPTRDDHLIPAMLGKFAEKAMRENPALTRVTIGEGGKTPKDLFGSILPIPEEIREGFHYGDSRRQCLIAFNEAMVKARIDAVVADAALRESVFRLDFFANYGSIMTLLLDLYEKYFPADPDRTKEFVQGIMSLARVDLERFNMLYEPIKQIYARGLLSVEVVDALFAWPSMTSNFLSSWYLLTDIPMQPAEVKRVCLDLGPHLEEFDAVARRLQSAGLLSEQSVKWLTEYLLDITKRFYEFPEIKNTFEVLEKHAQLTSANLSVLVGSPIEKIRIIAPLLRHLAGNEILTDKNRDFILAVANTHPLAAQHVAHCLSELHRVGLNEVNYHQRLLDNLDPTKGNISGRIHDLLSFLQSLSAIRNVVTDEKIDIILTNPAAKQSVARLMQAFSKAGIVADDRINEALKVINAQQANKIIVILERIEDKKQLSADFIAQLIAFAQLDDLYFVVDRLDAVKITPNFCSAIMTALQNTKQSVYLVDLCRVLDGLSGSSKPVFAARLDVLLENIDRISDIQTRLYEDYNYRLTVPQFDALISKIAPTKANAVPSIHSQGIFAQREPQDKNTQGDSASTSPSPGQSK